MKPLRNHRGGTVYLIHFHSRFHHAQHYIGYSGNLFERMRAHMAGRGSRLIEVIMLAGIGWSCVRTWSGDRSLERQLKNRKNAKALCPVCQKE